MASFDGTLSSPGDQDHVVYEEDQSFVSNPNRFFRVGQLGDGTDAQAGIVFTLTGPAQGDTIDSATIELFIDDYEGSIGDLTITTWADADLTQSLFDSTDLPHLITKTTASASVVNPTTDNTSSFTLDVASIVQEIVNDASWSSGSFIRFFFDHNASGNYEYRVIASAGPYIDPGEEPAFTGTYTAGGASVGQWPLVNGGLVNRGLVDSGRVS